MIPDVNTSQGQQAMKAIAKLQFSPDFKVYMGYLQLELDGLRKQNDRFSGDQLKWNQGKCQDLQAILDLPLLCSTIIKKH